MNQITIRVQTMWSPLMLDWIGIALVWWGKSLVMNGTHEKLFVCPS